MNSENRREIGLKVISLVKLFYLIVVFLMVFVLSLDANGAVDEHWNFVPGNSAEGGFYYDSNSIISIGPDLMRFWIKSTGKDGTLKRSLEELDCRNRVVRDIQTITEKPNKSSQMSNEPTSWRDVLGDPAMITLHKIICK